MPDFVLPNNVQETTTTAGTGPVTLLGAADASLLTLASPQIADGQWVFYAIWDDADYEAGLGEYHESGPTRTLTRLTIHFSTAGGSPVAWPGTGVRNVSISPTGQSLAQLLDPQKTGFFTRVGALDVRGRTWQDGAHIAVLNPDGAAGDPEIDDSLLDTRFARRDIPVSFLDIVALTAATTLLLGWSGTDKHTVLGKNAESMLDFVRDGLHNYHLEIAKDSTNRRVIVDTEPPANPGDDGKIVTVRGGDYVLEENWAPIVATSRENTMAALTAEVNIPSYGTWIIDVDVKIYAHGESGAWLKANIKENGTAKTGGYISALHNTPDPSHDLFISHRNEAPSASTTYTYTMESESSGITECPASEDVGASIDVKRDNHLMRITALRIA